MFILSISNVYALDISINEIKILDKSDDIIVGNVTTNNLTITPNITFNKINDYVIYKINFKGKDIKKYKIENITDNNKSDNIKITYKYKETLNEPLYIIIKYEKEVKDTLSLNDINITINLLGEDNEEEIVISDPPSGGETPPTNPKTGTLSHIIVPAILIIISVFLIKYYTKHKNDNTLIIVILCLTLIPLSVIAYESQKLTLVLKTSNISISKYAYAIEVHFNAFGEGANGTTTLCSSGDCGSGLNITNDIRNSINNILKTKNRGVSPQVTQNFNFFKSQNIPFTYLETEFYDNKTAMDNFKNNESQVALAIAKCIKKYYP